MIYASWRPQNFPQGQNKLQCYATLHPLQISLSEMFFFYFWEKCFWTIIWSSFTLGLFSCLSFFFHTTSHCIFVSDIDIVLIKLSRHLFYRGSFLFCGETGFQWGQWCFCRWFCYLFLLYLQYNAPCNFIVFLYTISYSSHTNTHLRCWDMDSSSSLQAFSPWAPLHYFKWCCITKNWCWFVTRWIYLCVRACVSHCAILFHLLLPTLYLSCPTPWPLGLLTHDSAMTFDLSDALLGPRQAKTN